ncbi:MAG: UDP-N-acetylglucosamine 2-epimerase (non-hydrolyzing) [Fimbriimonadaceae bacterium]|nr:UDP-N-acetylglucosamine 2-epimerase (non-hydrolyzing) [Fimbriimonadaceae bacterium]
MARPTALFVVGTRPDAIKSAAVVQEFQRFAGQIDTVLVSTGQHREMLDQALGAFGLEADVDLGLMHHGQTLASVTSRALEGLDQVIADRAPDLVLAQGDTTTTYCAGLAAFYRQVPFGHIEAGLRTPSIWSPFPEEFNRRALGLFARLHFAPTRLAADNLLAEGAAPDSVMVTGNTGIDAVQAVARQGHGLPYADHPGRVLLLTTHRRENWGEPQLEVARAALRLVEEFEDVLLVVPMHRNPAVRTALQSVLEGKPRCTLVEPPDYVDFVQLMRRSALILTDSGGVQEEAPAFGVPVLVLRDTTERPEGVEAGTARLVGTKEESVYSSARSLLADPAALGHMAQATNPYGDGMASQRVRYAALRFLGIESPEVPPWV